MSGDDIYMILLITPLVIGLVGLAVGICLCIPLLVRLLGGQPWNTFISSDQQENRRAKKMTLAEMRKTMPPCPICGKKAYLMHDVVDGFDFGYDAGCPSFCLDDGVHGISEPYHPDRPHINEYSAKRAYDGWLAYCERMKERAEHD